MLQEELVGKLQEIQEDANLPISTDELDKSYINGRWPGLIAGLTNFLIDSAGNRKVSSIAALKAAGFHTFTTNRTDNSLRNPIGRVRTTKGLIFIY